MGIGERARERTTEKERHGGERKIGRETGVEEREREIERATEMEKERQG